MANLSARDPISPYTFSYQGHDVLIRKSTRGTWCYGQGKSRVCEGSFRSAVVAAKKQIDAGMMHENPGPDGFVGFLLGAIIGAGGVFGYYWYKSNHNMTDPIKIADAKANTATLSTTLPGVTAYVADAPKTSSTPAFTQALAQVQAAINAHFNATAADLATIKQDAPNLKFPLRTDGVLDDNTYDWLLAAANG